MSGPRRYVVDALGICTGPNSTGHWAARRRRDAPIIQELTLKARSLRVGDPLRRARVTITLTHSRLFDADNAYGHGKRALDAIKGTLIVDDAMKYIELMVVQEKGMPPSTRIEVCELIEDIEDLGEAP